MGNDSSPVSFPAAADLTTKVRRFGKLTSTGVVACTVAGERADCAIGGYYVKTPAIGDAIDGHISRVFEIEAGGAVTRGDAITTDSVGRGVLATAGDNVAGICLSASGTLGSTIEVVAPLSRATVTPLVSDAALTVGQDGVLVFAIPDAATADYDKVIAEKCQVIEAWVIKSGAGAANTAQLKHGATAVSDAMAAAVDKATTYAATLDPAQTLYAVGDTMRVTFTRAAGSGLATVFVRVIRRA